ncbi:MAG TPA: hypothetical protein VK166_14460 [Chitinophagaceae bacterium]|nr:hypothetical protein [Chitinophagaceae bacterium]
MTHIQLRRSGGQIGKTLQASKDIDMDEMELINSLKQIAPVHDPQMRDDFSYKVVVNRQKSFPIDISQLKGKLKKIVRELEDDLKAENG